METDRPRILIVDDERAIREMLAEFLSMEGYLVETAEDGEAALSALDKSTYDVVLSDLKMPKLGGIELLGHLAEHQSTVLPVIMTGFGTVETAIDAMKRGAYDYVLKPFKLDDVLRVIRRGLEQRRLSRENLSLREAVSVYSVTEAISWSVSLDQVLDTIASRGAEELRADFTATWLETEGGVFREGKATQNPDWADRFGGAGRSEGTASAEGSSAEGSSAGGPSEGRVQVRLDSAAILADLEALGSISVAGPAAFRYFKDRPDFPVRGALAVPLRVKGKTLGFVIALSSTHSFDEAQRKLLTIVGGRAALAIENARLYENLQGSFQQTIEGLAKAIDKMDAYTAGHSDRVAAYGVLLARTLGLSEELVEVVRHSALMHDVGKIGCVLHLNKTGKLSQDEFEAFKQHPIYGRDILSPIKLLHPLVPGVHLHHERWDGRGYPLGLVGEQIPIVARIISVADAYDAMTSDRSYRKALPHAIAMKELKRCAGTQFDPDVAHPFTEAISSHRESEIGEGRKVPQ